MTESSSKLHWLRRQASGLTRPLTYALLGFVVFQWFGRTKSGPKEGELAADFTLTSAAADAPPIALASQRGYPTVVEVFASWCTACRSMAPTMADLASASRKREVRFIGVAVDTPADEAAALHKAWGIPFPVALGDAAFSTNFNIKVLPTVIVIDPDGRIRHVTSGTTRASTIDGWLAELDASRLP